LQLRDYGRSRRLQFSVGIVQRLDVVPPVYDDVAEVRENLRRAIPGDAKAKELRRVVDERRGGQSGPEGRMLDEIQEEGDIRLHAANPELAERAVGAL